MKQSRKNKTGQVLNIPTSTYYTLIQLFELNKEMKEITARVQHTKKIEAGGISEIGALTGGKGRPQKAFAVTPITQLTLDAAIAANINLVDNPQRLINGVSMPSQNRVVNITSPVFSKTN